MSDAGRQGRLRDKTREKRDEEVRLEAEALKARPDHFPELDYFLELLAAGPRAEVIARRTGRPAAALLCLQAPLELFHAYGLQPFKIFGGSQTAARLSAPLLPAVMCPMLRSALGALQLDLGPAGGDGAGFAAWVLPTTCDWAVKFPEMAEICGLTFTAPLHRLELPHLKDRPESQERWLEEIYGLKNFLNRLTGRKKMPRSELVNSLAVYQRAWRIFGELTDLKRRGLVPGVWALVISNAFFFDLAERWTAHLKAALPRFREGRARPERPAVFLAGSPVFFPNLKMPRLLEEAGLALVMDDLCSSERLFPGAVHYDDPSEHGLLKALAQRYHQGCLCPTFADNDRRVNNIISPARKNWLRGVVYQVLKGCHPFDLESLGLERRLKAEGLKFIRLETDYTAEDGPNLLTRLEAFRGSLA